MDHPATPLPTFEYLEQARSECDAAYAEWESTGDPAAYWRVEQTEGHYQTLMALLDEQSEQGKARLAESDRAGTANRVAAPGRKVLSFRCAKCRKRKGSKALAWVYTDERGVLVYEQMTRGAMIWSAEQHERLAERVERLRAANGGKPVDGAWPSGVNQIVVRAADRTLGPPVTVACPVHGDEVVTAHRVANAERRGVPVLTIHD